MELHCGEDVYSYVEDTDSLLSNGIEDSADNFIYDKWMHKKNYIATEGEKTEPVISLEADPLLSEAQLIDGYTLLDAFDIRIPQPQYVPKMPTPSETNNKRSNPLGLKFSEEMYEPEPKHIKLKESPLDVLKRINSQNEANESFSNAAEVIDLTSEDVQASVEAVDLNKPESVESPSAILRSVDNQSDSDSFEGLNKCDILLRKPPYTVEMIFMRNSTSLIFRDAAGSQIFLPQHMQLPQNYARPKKLQKIQSVTQVQICKQMDSMLPRIVTMLGAKIYLCPLKCTKAFLHIVDAKLHALKHMQIKPYKCDKPDCPWEFYTACKLARHKETHEKNKNFVCDVENCSRAFSTIYNLNEHKKKHTKPATLPCVVQGCEMLFQNEKQRRVHYKTHNESEAPLRCGNAKCTRSFFTQALFDIHRRNCIRREDEVVCHFKDCGKVFSTPYRLREHIRQHTGVRPYHCTFENCTWSFTTASKLKRHQSSHTGDRKFHCTIGDCKKSFLRSEHLKEHTLTHIEKRIVEVEGRSAILGPNKKSSPEKKAECTRVQPEEEDFATSSTNADALLEQAIQSLGVPSDMMMGAGAAPEQPSGQLEDQNLSTVNLRDLD